MACKKIIYDLNIKIFNIGDVVQIIYFDDWSIESGGIKETEFGKYIEITTIQKICNDYYYSGIDGWKYPNSAFYFIGCRQCNKICEERGM